MPGNPPISHGMFQVIARLFENWLDPFARSDDLKPPEKTWALRVARSLGRTVSGCTCSTVWVAAAGAVTSMVRSADSEARKLLVLVGTKRALATR